MTIRFKTGGKLKILDEYGNIQGYIDGGNRILSREDTKKVIDLALNAKSKDDLENLGLVMVKIVNKHKTNKQEYTSFNADYSRFS